LLLWYIFAPLVNDVLQEFFAQSPEGNGRGAKKTIHFTSLLLLPET